MSRLIAFGSSPIIYTHSKDTSLENVTYPAIIAQKLDREYLCIAKRWMSNSKIARKILSFEFEPGDVVLVTWTSTMRAEFRSEHGWFGINRESIKSGSFEETWYQGPGNWEYTSIMTALKEMLLAQTFLKSKGISYLFLFDNSEYLQSYRVANPDEYLGAMISMLDQTCILSFENNNGFINWCQEEKYEFDGVPGEKRGYPIQAAHQRAAEYILTKFQY